MSTPSLVRDLFQNSALSGLFRELQRPNLASLAYISAIRSAQQQGTSIYDSAAYADSQDSAFWWKIRRDTEFASYIENRRKSVAGLRALVVPGTKTPTDADILISRAQDYIWDLQPGARRTRYGLTEGIFRGSSWAAMTAVKRKLQLPGDNQPRIWWVPGKFHHVDRWRFRVQRDFDQGQGFNNAGGNFWEFFSWRQDKWVPLRHPEHFLTFFYDRTESDHGYGYGLNNSLYVWLKGKEIALNNGLRGLRRWASGIIKVMIDELRNASINKDNLQHALDWLQVVRTLYTEDILVHGKNDEVEVLWPDGTGHQIVMSLIEYFDGGAKRLIQSADPDGGNAGEGTFAGAVVQRDEKSDYFAFDRDNMSEDYTDQALSMFYRLNRHNYAALAKANGLAIGLCGRYQIGAREDMDPQAASEYIGKLQEAGFKIPEQWAHDIANVPVPREDEDILELPQPEGGGFGALGEEELNGSAGSAGMGTMSDIKMPTIQNPLQLQLSEAIPNDMPNIDLPGFDTGATYDCVSDEIRKLKKKGTPQDQSVAIALSVCGKSRNGGQRAAQYDATDDIAISAKAVIRNQAGEILLLKDAGTDWWDLPGGHIQSGEELVEGLAREVREETGLTITNPKKRGVKNLKLGDQTRPVVFFETEATGTVQISEEHEGAEFVAPEDLETKNLGVFLPVLQSMTMRQAATRMQTYQDGKWVTIGQGEGEGSGGTPVFIKDGKITKGPAAVEDQKIADVDKNKPPVEPTPPPPPKKKTEKPTTKTGVAPTEDELEDAAFDLFEKMTVDERDTVASYVRDGYTGLNAQLRECPETLDCLDSNNKVHAANWAAILDKAEDFAAPVDVFRGVHLSEEDAATLENAMFATIQSKEPISFNGISSMSLSKTIASEFALGAGGGKAMLFQIQAKSGAYLGDKMGLPGAGEKELTHGHGTEYQVVGATTETFEGESITVWKLEQI